MLIYLVGLTSYGIHFELERGQFIIISIALAFFGIFLFHKYPKPTWLAYILFILSIQLKIYPAVFIFLFIREWRNWKENIIRIAVLCIINFVLLFSLGWNLFHNFIQIIGETVNDPGVWVGNLSVRSFTHFCFPQS